MVATLEGEAKASSDNANDVPRSMTTTLRVETDSSPVSGGGRRSFRSQASLVQQDLLLQIGTATAEFRQDEEEREANEGKQHMAGI